MGVHLIIIAIAEALGTGMGKLETGTERIRKMEVT